jgi:Helix-hairpin-helix motif
MMRWQLFKTKWDWVVKTADFSIKTRALGLLFQFCFLVSSAQTAPKTELDIAQLFQQLAPIQTEEADYENIYENLYTLYQKPIDLNRADADALRPLFFLSELQINDIINHKQRFGPFLSVYELQSVPSMRLEDIRNLLPFISIKNTFQLSQLKNAISEHYFVFRTDRVFENAKGYAEEKYGGTPQRYYSRYRLSHSKDFSLGFVSEKDPGEKNMLDYFSFHAQIQNKGLVKNAIIGDYLMQMGQGLIFSAGFAPGKGSEPVFSARRSNVGIKPFNSVLENASFRGTAITLEIGKFSYTAMASLSRKDASVGKPIDTQEEYFTALQTSGLHRTETEIANQNQINEKNIGGNLLYRVGPIQFGFSALATFFDTHFEKRPQPYNANEFVGKSNLVMGPNASFSWQNFNFFGEAARSSSGGFGYIGGFVASLNPKTEWAFTVRNYQPHFHSFYGSAFSEGSRTINEKGLYTGLKYTLKKGIYLAGFYDSFYFPWLKFGIDTPSEGYDYQIRVHVQPKKTFSQYLAFHHEKKEKNVSQSMGSLRGLTDVYRENLILGTEYMAGLNLKFQNKIQYNVYKTDSKDRSDGWAVIQDIETKWKQLQIKTRVAYFHTQTYDSRIYAYENDVLYAVSFPAYYGKGMRYYALFKYGVGHKTDIWLRWSATKVSDRPYMGSGNDQLPGPIKNDLKLQIKYNFK